MFFLCVSMRTYTLPILNYGNLSTDIPVCKNYANSSTLPTDVIQLTFYILRVCLLDVQFFA